LKATKISINNPNYEPFAETHGTVFNSKDWIKVFGEGIETHAIYHESGALVGLFNLYKTELKGIPTYANPPFTPDIGLCLKKQEGSAYKTSKFEKEVSQTLSKYFDNLDAKILQVSFPPQFVDMQPFIWGDFNVSPKYTYVTNLELSEEELMKNIAGKTKGLIKKGIKDNLEIVLISNFNEIYDVIAGVLQRNTSKPNLEVLRKILQDFSTDKNAFAIASKEDGEYTSVSYCTFDSNRAWYLFGGHSVQQRPPAAGRLVLWSCILEAKKRGVKEFDFEGSMVQDIERFFRGFGGKLTPYFSVSKTSKVLGTLLRLKGKKGF